MKEPNEQDVAQSFSQWLDQQASVESVEAKLSSDDEQWQKRLATAQFIQHQVAVEGEQAVPQWHRAASFSTNHKPWWQWRGLPAMSMVLSLFTLSLVVFKVEFSLQESGFTVSFAGSKETQQLADINRAIDEKLQSFASEQQVVLANYAADIKVKQQDNNLQLASYILAASRKERKEDISDFIQYVNEQRADQQFDNQLKFQQLEQAIRYKTLTEKTYPAQATSWSTEE